MGPKSIHIRIGVESLEDWKADGVERGTSGVGGHLHKGWNNPPSHHTARYVTGPARGNDGGRGGCAL